MLNTDGLVVHPRTTKLLEQFLLSPPHALLLHGGKGLGKTELARRLAAAMLQTVHTDIGHHEYFRSITPEDGLTTTIDQVRSLQSFVRLKVPGVLQVSRVVLFDDADTLNVQAQNALLKLLEEPPEGTVLVLVTSHAATLLATVRSRLQALNVYTPADAQIVSHFSVMGHSESDIRRALLITGGSIAAMQTQLTDTDRQNDMFEAVKNLLSAPSFERLCQVESFSKDKIAAKQFVVALKQLATASMHQSASGKQTSLGRWYGIVQASQTAEQALRFNGNPKLVLTDLVLSL